MYDTTKPYKKRILNLIRKTWDTPYVKVKKSIYPIFERKFGASCIEVDHTDGIGTKGIFHWEKKTFKEAVQDALAMNLNDLLLTRATPYKLQNHILLPEDDVEAIMEVMKYLVEECRRRKIAITGGETSIHNNLKGMDISITVSGFIELENMRPNRLKCDDVLIGLKSTGLHSNGFTRAREIFGDTRIDELVAPTAIYADALMQISKKCTINGMMHITGGAFTKLKVIMPKNVDVIIRRGHELEPQPIFRELYAKGITDEEMYRTFNCGIGFIVSTASSMWNAISRMGAGNADMIGWVERGGSGKIRIESAFSKKIVEY